MSEQTTNGDELTKMKLGDLKKLCKKHNLSTSGTKVDLISRLVETNSDAFTILQPGDEDKLLGEVDEPSTFSQLTTTTTAAAAAAGPTPIPSSAPKAAEHVTGMAEPLPPSVSAATISPGSKRPASSDTPQLLPTAPVQPPVVDKPVVATATLPDAERIAARANRFGTSRPAGLGSLSDDKLAARARRFGLPVSEDGAQSGRLRVQSNPVAGEPSTGVDEEEERRRKRAERFGLTEVDTMSETQRKARRLERFGAAPGVPTEKSDDEAKAARALKFGLQTDAEKLQQRKARFGVA